MKWAEEGYAVCGITASIITGWSIQTALKQAIDALVTLKELDTTDKVGIVGR